jgi:ATP-dependent Clp protease ATP-binding subunit ClpC
MFERFTDRSRTVMRLAQEAAQQSHHDHIGTEHILLGLIREGGGIAAAVLGHVGDGVSEQNVLTKVPTGPARSSTGLPHVLQTPRIVESAMDEARHLRHSYVGTEHLLLALLREKDSLAAALLSEVAPLEQFRKAVHAILGTPVDEM